MILNRLALDVQQRHVFRDSGDVYELHSTVSTLTRELPPGDGRVLWSQPQRRLLLIQATGVIDADNLPAGYTLESADAVRLEHGRGETVSWSLIANPTIQRSRTRVRSAVPLEQRDDWVRGKLQPALVVGDLSGQQHTVRGGLQRSTGKRVCHVHHVWSGTATVADADALRRLILCGVGRARGFGCGLLLVGGAA